MITINEIQGLKPEGKKDKYEKEWQNCSSLFKQLKGAFINDVTQIKTFFSPSPSVAHLYPNVYAPPSLHDVIQELCLTSLASREPGGSFA